MASMQFAVVAGPSSATWKRIRHFPGASVISDMPRTWHLLAACAIRLGSGLARVSQPEKRTTSPWWPMRWSARIPKNAALAEEAGDLVEIVAVWKTGACLPFPAGAQHPGVEQGVVQRSVECAVRMAPCGSLAVDAGEEFPVSHVARHQDQAGAAAEGFLGELGVLDGDDLILFPDRKVPWNGGADSRFAPVRRNDCRAMIRKVGRSCSPWSAIT